MEFVLALLLATCSLGHNMLPFSAPGSSAMREVVDDAVNPRNYWQVERGSHKAPRISLAPHGHSVKSTVGIRGTPEIMGYL